MARTESAMPALGTIAPDFCLPDVLTGKAVTLDDFAGKKAVLVMFICRHCPYVQHIKHGLALLGTDYHDKPLGIVAISANDADAYPDDHPDSLREMAKELGFTFPLCYDKTQETAKAYAAVCTPDFFLYDGSRRLAYRGQFDGSRPRNDEPVTGRDLRGAIDALLGDRPVDLDQKPSLGCSIKWRNP